MVNAWLRQVAGSIKSEEMSLGSILQFFVSHVLVWITNQSEWLFKLLIPKRLCAFAGVELKGWVRISLTSWQLSIRGLVWFQVPDGAD